MTNTTAMHLKNLEQTLLAIPGSVFHPSILVSVPRSYKSAVIGAAKRLGLIEIASYNHMGQPMYRIGEVLLCRRAAGQVA